MTRGGANGTTNEHDDHVSSSNVQSHENGEHCWGHPG